MRDGSLLRERSVLQGDPASSLADDADQLGRIDLLTAGYPCQPFSTAARGRNTAADLWPEARRVIQRCRPRWVVLENVPGRRLEHVERSCRELESLGYAVWPIDAAVEIRKHVRRRIWVVAHSDREGEPQFPVHAKVAGVQAAARCGRGDAEPLAVDDGLPRRMARMKALGNAVEVEVVELLIRALFSGDSPP
jgi:DNA (cytosine-5)-methyltransferase 1